MDKDKLNNLRHSCAHLLAAAVMELWPGAKRTIGPAIENGFYYDFDFGNIKITEENLPKIEARMKQILPGWIGFEKHELTAGKAKKEYPNNQYKHELIEEFTKKGQKVSFYKSGNYWDLCKGGHIENPSREIGAFRLLSIAGAYWKGSEKNPMLTRVYGTCFNTQKELDEYLQIMEEAKKRDHKKLGPQLELFFFHQTAPGMAYWLPKGVVIYNELIKLWREEHLKRGYLETFTPILNKKELYITSGHFDHYWQDMFVADMGEKEVYGVKAMNCPNAMTIFGFKSRSYRDLPLRLGDTDPLHRYEQSGVLNGLFRIRAFRQDDAHIFVSEYQIEDEYARLFEIVEKFYSIFKLEYSFRLGKRPERFMGDKSIWNKAEQILEKILKNSQKPFEIAEGEGAFYGPKIDILMKDSLGRSWQMGTLQLDFQQPARFDLKFTDADGKVKIPIVIHRVIYGSLERFIGILVEHYAGAFPVWISPIQVQIIPIANRHELYGQKVLEQLNNAKTRAEIDAKQETMQAKIRHAQSQKIPYMLIVGDREEKEKKIAVRTRSGQDLGAMTIEDFLAKIKSEIESKT